MGKLHAGVMIAALARRHALKKDDEVFGLLEGLRVDELQMVLEGLEFLTEMTSETLKRKQKGNTDDGGA